MVFTSSKPRVDALVPIDVLLTTMPCKYSTARFVCFKYCPLERTMLQVTTLSVPGHVLLIASSMLSWTLGHSASFFARRSPPLSRPTTNGPTTHQRKPQTSHFWCQSVDWPPANPPPLVTWSVS